MKASVMKCEDNDYIVFDDESNGFTRITSNKSIREVEVIASKCENIKQVVASFKPKEHEREM